MYLKIGRGMAQAILFIAIFLAISPRAMAQSCDYATIVNDSTYSLDINQVCDAAKPLAEQGIELFVLLNDQNFATDEEWNNYLIQTEQNNGFMAREGTSQYAIEANTEEMQLSYWWGNEALENVLKVNKAKVQQAFVTGFNDDSATDALVGALKESNTLLNSSNVSSSSGSSSNGGSSILPLVLGAGAIGAGGLFLYPRVVKPAMSRKKEEEEWSEHLQTLKGRVANLLLASEKLLGNDSAEASILYQIFDTYGGTHHPEMTAHLTDWLEQSQSALTDAFILRDKLLDTETEQKRGLKQSVEDWERIYITLVGSHERITNLSDAELHTLLDPMQILERKPKNNRLSSQLDQISKEIEGIPLKIELKVVDPATMDEEGILGYIDGIQTEIGRLQDAEKALPDRLDHVTKRRANMEQSDPFGITEGNQFKAIDARIASIQADQKNGLYLQGVNSAEWVDQALDINQTLRETAHQWQTNHGTIQEIQAEGYRPAQLDEDLAEITEDYAQLNQALETGDYEAVASWTNELQIDSERANNHAVGWREMFHTTTERIAQARIVLSEHHKFERMKVQTAWADLRNQYPAGNWRDSEQDLILAQQAIAELPPKLDDLAEDNGMDVQRFLEADAGITSAENELALVKTQLDGVIQRLAEVRSAEKNLPSALRKTVHDIAQAESFRNQEDAKISPQVDEWLVEARNKLQEAQASQAERNFVAALHAQTMSDELATAAYKSANEQVAHINQLQHGLVELIQKTDGEAIQLIRYTNQLERGILTKTLVKEVDGLRDQLNQARITHAQAEGAEDSALAELLTKATLAYEKVSEQVAETSKAVTNAEAEYDQALDQVRSAVSDARRAILEAKQTGNRLHSGSQWRRYNEKAERAIPNEPTGNESIEELKQMLGDAENAESLADKAKATARRSQQDNDRHSGGGFGGGFGGGGFPRPSQMPRGRGMRMPRGGGIGRGLPPISRPAPRMPRMGGGSRGSSGGGGSRGSSGGGSRG